MTLDEAREKLKAAAFADFVKVRTEIAAELKAQGDAHLARLLLSAKKPDRIAWALVRVDDELKTTLERERTFAQAAQAHKKGDELRDALASYRAAVTAVMDATKAVMHEADMSVNAATERAIRAAVEGRHEDPLEVLTKK
jgi:hypothetical protein